MPYIKKEKRNEMKDVIRHSGYCIKSKGDLNYFICELVGQLCMRDSGLSYTKTSNWIDAVHGAERELTRRLLDSYEDLKIKENGDVESFKTLIAFM